MSCSITFAARACMHRSHSLRLGSASHRITRVLAFNSSADYKQHCFSTVDNNKNDDDVVSKDDDLIVYEGPFAKLSLRLKRVSITTAVVSLVGIPLLITLHGGDVPATGQAAVGGTALLACGGSTLAMSYCFSPYVHTIEKVPVRQCKNVETPEACQSYLYKATTYNIFGFRKETVFDIGDVKESTSSRPFCNLEAKHVPLYIHPELLNAEPLRSQLIGIIGEKPDEQFVPKEKDDEFF